MAWTERAHVEAPEFQSLTQVGSQYVTVGTTEHGWWHCWILFTVRC